MNTNTYKPTILTTPTIRNHIHHILTTSTGRETQHLLAHTTTLATGLTELLTAAHTAATHVANLDTLRTPTNLQQRLQRRCKQRIHTNWNRITTAPTLDTTIDELVECWHLATADTLTDLIQNTHRTPRLDRPAEDLAISGKIPTAYDRAGDRAVDHILHHLITTALTQPNATPTGWAPSDIRTDANASGRYGQGEVNILDPLPPTGDTRYAPTIRVRRLLDAITRIPDLNLFAAATDHAIRASGGRDNDIVTETLTATRSHLTRKILTDRETLPTEGASELRLHTTARGHSFLAWVRKSADTISGSKLRDATNRRARALTADFQPPTNETHTPQHGTFAAYLHESERTTTAPDEHLHHHNTNSLEHGLHLLTDPTTIRGLDRLHIGAVAIRDAYAIPEPTPNLTGPERDLARAAYLDDPTLAATTLKAYHDQHVGTATSDQTKLDPRLLRTWHGYTPTQADLLLGCDPRVPHLIALAALTPMPRPRNLAPLTLQLLATSQHPDWATHAPTLAELYRPICATNTPSERAWNKFVAYHTQLRQHTPTLRIIPDTPEATLRWLRRIHTLTLQLAATQRRDELDTATIHAHTTATRP